VGWRVETRDVGPGGCLVASTRPLAPGQSIRITLLADTDAQALEAAGRVAWTSPPDVGIAFTGSAAEARAWYDRLILGDARLKRLIPRAPQRIDPGARLYLLPPPRILDLSADEAALVGQAVNGITAAELLVRAGLRDGAERALFTLFDKRILTLAVGEATPDWTWRRALEAAGYNVPTTTSPPDISRSVPARVAQEARTRPDQASAIPLPAPAAASPPGAPPRPAVDRQHLYDPRVGARETAELVHGVCHARSERVEQLVEAARAAAGAARQSEAVKLLREALALAPRDKEIAKLFASIAFRVQST
jgi:hypothetical protein